MSAVLLRRLTRVAFVWAALLTMLWPLSVSVCTRTIADSFVTAMRSDLVFLGKAQAEFHSSFGRYAVTLEELRTHTRFVGSSAVHVSIERAGIDAWSARAVADRAPRWSCTTTESVERPRCVKQTTWAERHIPKPTFGTTVLEFWLVWLTLVRRQRREAIAMAWRERAPAT